MSKAYICSNGHYLMTSGKPLPGGNVPRCAAPQCRAEAETVELSDGDQALCGCGIEIVWLDNEWQHDAAPSIWGDDHPANPSGVYQPNRDEREVDQLTRMVQSHRSALEAIESMASSHDVWNATLRSTAELIFLAGGVAHVELEKTWG